MTIRPAAGPLIVICELLMNVQTRPPTTAVQMPAMGGKLLALAMARHRGSAMRKTRKPARASKRRLPSRPLFGGGSLDFVSATKIPFGLQEPQAGQLLRGHSERRATTRQGKSDADRARRGEIGQKRPPLSARAAETHDRQRINVVAREPDEGTPRSLLTS